MEAQIVTAEFNNIVSMANSNFKLLLATQIVPDNASSTDRR
jgi:hypothetical protein